MIVNAELFKLSSNKFKCFNDFAVFSKTQNLKAEEVKNVSALTKLNNIDWQIQSGFKFDTDLFRESDYIDNFIVCKQ